MAECFDCVFGAGSRERVNIRFTRKKDDYNKYPIVILRVNTPSKQFVREEYKRMEKYWENVCMSELYKMDFSSADFYIKITEWSWRNIYKLLCINYLYFYIRTIQYRRINYVSHNGKLTPFESTQRNKVNSFKQLINFLNTSEYKYLRSIHVQNISTANILHLITDYTFQQVPSTLTTIDPSISRFLLLTYVRWNKS